MKRECKKSCIDISKYKFIPPSKLIKARTQLTNKKYLHFQSLIDSNLQQQSSQNIYQQKINQCQHLNKNKQNYVKINKQNNLLFRSISNSKLNTSNSRNAILTQKYPPIQNKKYQKQIQFNKLIQIITQLQIKNTSKNNQITSLKQQKKLYHQNIDKLNLTIAFKNKQIIDLNNKVKIIQSQSREKCQQYILIIDSLKKVIQSQVTKINQLTNQKITPPSKNKPKSLICYQFPTIQFYQQQQSIQHDIIYQKTSKNSSNKNIQSLLYQSQPKKNKDFVTNTQKDDTRQQNYFQYLDTGTHIQSQNLKKQPNDLKYHSLPPPPPPISQPSTQKSKLPHSQSDTLYSLDCSLDQAHNNLSLSRISQSVQQDFQTSRQIVKTEKVQKYINKPSYSNSSTHQQLLEEIDQYLSKRTNTGHKK